MEPIDYTELLESIIANQESIISGHEVIIENQQILISQGITNIGYMHWLVVGLAVGVIWYLLYTVLKKFTQI